MEGAGPPPAPQADDGFDGSEIGSQYRSLGKAKRSRSTKCGLDSGEVLRYICSSEDNASRRWAEQGRRVSSGTTLVVFAR